MGFFSSLFGKSEEEKRREEEKRQMHALFDAILTLLNDDDVQNSQFPPFLKQQMRTGHLIDPNVFNGLYGRSPEYPIRVNGPLGEITYLSKLIVEKTGAPLIFHRLGSMEGNIDIYEVISLDGTMYDLLYFDMYYQYKSEYTPSGYSFLNEVRFLGGVDYTTTDFPEDITDTLFDYTEKRFGIPLVNPILYDLDFELLGRVIDYHRSQREEF